MRRLILTAGLLALAACSSGGGAGGPKLCEAPVAQRPNFLVVLTDDQERGLDAYMPSLQTLIGDRGLRFDRAYVTTSLCCPSRASILTGQYAHNHGVLSNSLERGGYGHFRDGGAEARSLGTRLKSAGYTTGYFGKYLNGYPSEDWKPEDPAVIPPGWDQWMAAVDLFPKTSPYVQFDYDLIDQGHARHYGKGADDYFGDVITQRATGFLNEVCGPFIAFVAFISPHWPGTPAPRHRTDAVTAPPLSPSYMEADISDKPRWLRASTPPTDVELAKYAGTQLNRLRSLRAVDESIAEFIGILERRQLLANTYVLFMGDNGWHMGEHRLPYGKDTAYEEDVGIPMFWRGPGIVAGARSNALALNIDVTPTLLDLAGVTSPPEMTDGRSLWPLFTNPATPWRSHFLIEHYSNVVENIGQPVPNPFGLEYSALHDGESVYVEYAYGDREYYDLQSDPHQLLNTEPGLEPARRAELSAELARLRDCKGPSCEP